MREQFWGRVGLWAQGSEPGAFESSSSGNGQGFLFQGGLLPLLMHRHCTFKRESSSWSHPAALGPELVGRGRCDSSPSLTCFLKGGFAPTSSPSYVSPLALVSAAFQQSCPENSTTVCGNHPCVHPTLVGCTPTVCQVCVSRCWGNRQAPS